MKKPMAPLPRERRDTGYPRADGAQDARFARVFMPFRVPVWPGNRGRESGTALVRTP